jgi:hypothetical protein
MSSYSEYTQIDEAGNSVVVFADFAHVWAAIWPDGEPVPGPVYFTDTEGKQVSVIPDAVTRIIEAPGPPADAETDDPKNRSLTAWVGIPGQPPFQKRRAVPPTL